ncbi:hypothetical protein PQ455_16840 [Sphingomonas naphthae]|uniref:Uncharacterized protein n=1 Tax=Sphingomonas naphthae TaxID=1813468 RepID=A0ABY7TJ57_9SPHN|nr:hypothetical protein [Sphingomonas naphthae]WCT73263.1 hypothetical protein PQ455_16840 [Sphingomonas naphthae]
MTVWADQVRLQVRLIIDQIANIRARSLDNDGTMGVALESYYKMLDDLYDRDLRLAEVRDKSDLVLRVEGVAFDGDPNLQLVTSIFSNVTSQVTGLTKAILGVWADGRVTPKSVDLGLSGIARGSLYFGLKAQIDSNKYPVLGEIDTLFDSTRRALKIIDDVAHTIEHDSDKVSLEEVSEIIVDPKIRDAALVAVQRISPTGRRGIDAVSVSGTEGAPAELTNEHRKAIRQSLDRPVIRGEEIEFIGQVREIDLDSRRFDLRGIADEQVRDVRCAYRTVDISPRNLLGATVRARGLVERTNDEIPRLMSVTSLSIIREAPEHLI